ncbi:MAG TPA: STAS domain-containing protein [Acidimicrobiia bacterium]|nr:STAS domain-containing protein [Acidimicrobiia bacterium]
MPTAAPFEVTTSIDGDRTTVTVRGEIDLLAAPALRAALLDAAQSGVPDVVLKMADASFLDSTGLSVIVQAWRRLDADGRQLRIAAASVPVTRVITTSGLVELLGFDASR